MADTAQRNKSAKESYCYLVENYSASQSERLDYTTITGTNFYRLQQPNQNGEMAQYPQIIHDAFELEP